MQKVFQQIIFEIKAGVAPKSLNFSIFEKLRCQYYLKNKPSYTGNWWHPWHIYQLPDAVNTWEIAFQMCDSFVDICDSTVNMCDSAVKMYETAVEKCDSAVNKCDSAVDKCNNAVDMCDSAVDVCDSAVNMWDSAVDMWDSAADKYDSATNKWDSAVDMCDSAVDTERNWCWQMQQHFPALTVHKHQYWLFVYILSEPYKTAFLRICPFTNHSLMSVVSRCRPNNCNKLLYFQQKEIILLIFSHTWCSKMITIG